MRDVRAIMAELAASGLSPDQLALVMELTASLSVEARPIVDKAAENKRAYDRDYRRRKRTKSYDTDDAPPNDKSSNPPHSSSKATPSSMKPDPFPCPEFADPSHWRDFMANRKRKRLPSTATAYAGVLRDIAKFTDDDWPPGRIVQHAAEKGWGGIYDPRPKEQANGQQRQTTGLRGSRPDPAIDLLRQARSELARSGEDPEPDSGTGTPLPSYLTGRS